MYIGVSTRKKLLLIGAGLAFLLSALILSLWGVDRFITDQADTNEFAKDVARLASMQKKVNESLKRHDNFALSESSIITEKKIASFQQSNALPILGSIDDLKRKIHIDEAVTKKYAVQFKGFASETQAQQFIKRSKLAQKNPSIFLRTDEQNNSLYKVQFGSYKNLEDAVNAQKKARKEHGRQAVVIKL